MKVGDLVVPSNYMNYKEIYPTRMMMVVEVIKSERSGKPVRLYILEGEMHIRREETLLLVSEA